MRSSTDCPQHTHTTPTLPLPTTRAGCAVSRDPKPRSLALTHQQATLGKSLPYQSLIPVPVKWIHQVWTLSFFESLWF